VGWALTGHGFTRNPNRATHWGPTTGVAEGNLRFKLGTPEHTFRKHETGLNRGMYVAGNDLKPADSTNIVQHRGPGVISLPKKAPGQGFSLTIATCHAGYQGPPGGTKHLRALGPTKSHKAMSKRLYHHIESLTVSHSCTRPKFLVTESTMYSRTWRRVLSSKILRA